MGKDLKGKELGTGISQRKDGVYQGRYTDQWGARKTIYHKDLRQLRIKLAEAITSNAKYESIREDITLDQWYERWMQIYKDKKVRPDTQLNYHSMYHNYISPYLGNRELKTLVKSDIQRLVDQNAETLSVSTQKRVIAILRDILQRAVEDRLLLYNPVSKVKYRDSEPKDRRVLTIEEQKTFFEFSKNTFYDPLFQVAVNTGLRPGELLALTEEDLDFENGWINVTKTLVYRRYLTETETSHHVEPPKTKKSIRKVPMNSICREQLKKQIELKKVIAEKHPNTSNPFLFCSRKGRPLSVALYNYEIFSVIRRINFTRSPERFFPCFTGHIFRHTFATRCFEAGVNPKVVQTYLGHTSIKMTMDLYTHVTEEQSSSDIEKIISAEPKKIIPIRSQVV